MTRAGKLRKPSQKLNYLKSQDGSDSSPFIKPDVLPFFRLRFRGGALFFGWGLLFSFLNCVAGPDPQPASAGKASLGSQWCTARPIGCGHWLDPALSIARSLDVS
jgi:hypothetical protein